MVGGQPSTSRPVGAAQRHTSTILKLSGILVQHGPGWCRTPRQGRADGRDRHAPGPGAGQRLLPGGPGRRPRAGAGPLARPRPLPGRRRPPRPAAGLQRGDAPARRLRLRQPRAGRPRRHRPRAGRGPARVPPSRPGRRRPARPGRPWAAGAGHPRPHPRAPGLPAGRRRPTAGAVLRRVAAGRRRGPHRPDQPRPHPTAGQGAVALAAPAGPDAARRPGRLPHPRGRVVLLRPHRHRANHHHRPREGHQSAAGRPRRGHLRQAAGGRARLLPPLLPTAARDQPPRPPHLGRHPAAADPTGPTAGAPPGRRGRRAGRRTTDRRLRRRARPRRAVDPAAPLVRHLAGLAGARRPPAAGRAGARPGPRRPGPPGPQGRLRAAGRRAGRRDGRLALRRPARGPDRDRRGGRAAQRDRPGRPAARRVRLGPPPRRTPRRAWRPHRRRRAAGWAAGGDVRPRRAGHDRRQPAPGGRPLRLGIRTNLAQFSLLVGVNALVGGMVGQERTVMPLLATRTFHLQAFSAALSFIVVFGATKALTNLFAGTLSDRLGRKPVLVAGWLVGLPVPLLVIWAPSWGWVVAANVLLGINQGLTWSTTVIMKIDLAGPKRRGLAMGLNEAAGYGAVAATALATGFIAQHAGLRPEPFFLGIGYAGRGLGLSALVVRETRGHAQLEATTHVATSDGLGQGLSAGQVFVLTSFKEKALSAASQAGLVNNLNDGMAWGLFPLLYADRGLSVAAIGTLAAIYPAVWGLGQLLTGALSDRLGRKWLIAGGMLVQAGGIAIIAGATGFGPWAAGSVLLGVGTAMVYPTLLAAIGDVAHPSWRASAVGVYRLWRDGGYALGAILAGVLADRFGLTAAVWAIAALTAASGLVVAVRMYETHRRTPGRSEPPTGHTVAPSRATPANGHVPVHQPRMESTSDRPGEGDGLA